MDTNPRGGLAFDDEDVAAAYAHRPPYPNALFAFLDELPGQRRRALDLGCGTGKLAHRLAASFECVDAVDPSAAMLRVARDDHYPNIHWIHGFAETAKLADRYDVVTAGASIHWMDHAALFPRLADVLDPEGYIAIVEGDGAHDPAWQVEWEGFLARWLARLGSAYVPAAYRARMTAYRDRLAIAGERTFEGTYSQSIASFIECQHSRATWSRANLGDELSAEFDAELREVLLRYAVDGVVTYKTRAEVVWGGSGE